MTDEPVDPFTHPVAVWDHMESGALIHEQLLALPVARALNAVLNTLNRGDLADVLVFIWLSSVMPDWRCYADGERSSTE